MTALPPSPTLPRLSTARLVLRPWALADAATMRELVSDERVLRRLALPHPYPEGAAETFIGTHLPDFAAGNGIVLALTLRDSGQVIGCIGLHVDPASRVGYLGYWLGVEHWGRGYCTEAARAVVDYGFGTLGLERVHSSHYGSNPASGHVMEKLGMVHEATLRRHKLRWGTYEDDVHYGILRAEYEALAQQ